jgi:two-component system, OmpR family, sensor histidine kinase SenX3
MMKMLWKEWLLRSGSLAALSLVLLALAALQYRWSGEVSQAASTRMQASLDTSVRSFKHDFYQELGAVCFPFQTTFISNPDWDLYAGYYEEWKRSAGNPELVANVFVWETARGKASRLLRLNLTTKHFEPIEWPQRIASFRNHLVSVTQRPGPLRFNSAPEYSQGYRPSSDGIRAATANRLAWEIDQNIPALIHPLVQFTAGPIQKDGSEGYIIGWVVIQINLEALRARLLPELILRHFSGPNGLIYRVAVVGGEASDVLVYSSNSDFGKQNRYLVDVVESLMSPPPPFQSPADTAITPHNVGSSDDGSPPIVFPSWGIYRPGGPPILQVLRYSQGEKEWQLLVRNRQGSLESMVAGLRRRTLIISFGVLLLLVASIAMLFVTSHRAHKLARLQMDFVACVSHELRTPVAVICSTADNLADGVVVGEKQVMRYGGVIRNQAHQLADLIERILLFVATRSDAIHYNLGSVQVSEVVDRALANIAGMIVAGGITVERRIDSDLPLVMGDRDALVQCVQNLLTNAVKYGGEHKWIGVRTGLSRDGGQERYVEVTVEDKGPGVEPSELDHIFEPFYRGRTAAARQIRGTGLGLALARTVAEAMGGRLTVKSVLEVGSTFTLSLALPDSVPPAAELENSLEKDLVRS